MSIAQCLCLMGPTASGKTDLAVKLSEQLPVDIISVDSAMIYRGMDIGTAKPDKAILAQAPHQLIDIRDPTESYSAADFREDALKAIAKSLANKRIPLLVGGTMLYFKALLQGLTPLPAADEAVRHAILTQAETDGWAVLHARLAEVDPAAAKRIHPNDTQRLQRALEVYDVTGKPLTQWWAEQAAQASPYTIKCFALMPPRALLHERIAKRLEQMFLQGFMEEVKTLRAQYELDLSLPALRSVGYRQVWQHLNGEYDEPTAKARALFATRQFAKRQATWLKSWPNLEVLSLNTDNNLEQLLRYLKGVC